MQEGRDRGQGCYCQLLQGSYAREETGSPVGFFVPPFFFYSMVASRNEGRKDNGLGCGLLLRSPCPPLDLAVEIGPLYSLATSAASLTVPWGEGGD